MSLPAGTAQGISSIGGGIGDILASGDYSKEASIYKQDIQLAKESTALQEYVANKQIFAGEGAQTAAYAASGLKSSGSALDVLRNTAQLGSLRKSQISIQGAIEENNFNEQAIAASSQATTSMISGATGVASGVASLFGG